MYKSSQPSPSTSATAMVVLPAEDVRPAASPCSVKWPVPSFRKSAFGPPRAVRIKSKSPSPSTSAKAGTWTRSEEHTSELQSRLHLVCRLLLEKKKNKQSNGPTVHKHSCDS